MRVILATSKNRTLYAYTYTYVCIQIPYISPLSFFILYYRFPLLPFLSLFAAFTYIKYITVGFILLKSHFWFDEFAPFLFLICLLCRELGLEWQCSNKHSLLFVFFQLYRQNCVYIRFFQELIKNWHIFKILKTIQYKF